MAFVGPAPANQLEVARLRQALSMAAVGLRDDVEVLKLVNEADHYSEAMLLARASAGAFSGPIPSVPAELEAVQDAEFVFDSWNVVHSEAVSRRLTEIREERDAWLNQRTDEELEAYEANMKHRYSLLRRGLSAELGRTYDARPGAGVVEGPDGSIWRRKQVRPLPPRLEPAQGEPGGRALTDSELRNAQRGPEALANEPPSAAQDLDERVRSAWNEAPAQRPSVDDIRSETKPLGQITGGTDQRWIRSRYNGLAMNTAVWGPQMLLMHEDANPDPAYGTHLPVLCTGTKISKRIIITAGHCLFRNGSWNETRRFLPGADGIGQTSGGDASPNGYDNSLTRDARDEWVDHEWLNYDFGLLVLWDTSPLRCWWHHGWVENGTGLTGDWVYLYGYPGHDQNCDGAGSPRADNKCWGSIYGMEDNVVSEGAWRFYYTIDAQDGQSGSGVYKISGGNRYVWGVHSQSVGCCENSGVRINAGNANHIQQKIADYPASPC